MDLNMLGGKSHDSDENREGKKKIDDVNGDYGSKTGGSNGKGHGRRRDSSINGEGSKINSIYNKDKQYPRSKTEHSNSGGRNLIASMVPNKLNPTRQKLLKAIKLKNHKESLEHCTKLIQNKPNSCTYRCERAEIFLNLGEKSQALEDLDHVLKLKPDKSHALFLRGILLYRDFDKKNQAIDELRKALKIEPNNTLAFESHKICAEYFTQEKNNSEMIYHVNAGLLIKSQDPWLLNKQALIHYQRNEFSLAIGSLNIVLLAEPDNIDALHLRGDTYKKLSNYQKSLKDITKALDLSPTNPLLILKRAKLFKLLEKYEESLNDLEQLIGLSLDPKSAITASLFSNRGQAYQGLSRYKEALNDYTKALNLKPKASTYRRRAQIYQILRQYQDAVGDAKLALKIGKGNDAKILRQYQDAVGDAKLALKIGKGNDAKILRQYQDAVGDAKLALKIDLPCLFEILLRNIKILF
ncbi:7357_t:CDS:2 [Entrophospora sp. SA101]|nr:7357_t:CDS:2 [Entrophospora sp. SA101]